MFHPTKLKTKIISSGIFLPPQIVSSDELFEEFDSEKNYGIPTDWMSNKMGIKERRMSGSSVKPSELAIPAAKMAVENLKDLAVDDIDLIIFCGIERDQPEPATAHTIKRALGINALYVFDVSNACFGFVDALQIADSYISNQIARAALIVTGEIPTRVLRAAIDMLKEGVDIKTARNIVGALSVGDAGGAIIVGSSEDSEGPGFELFNSRIYSEMLEKCIYKTTEKGKIRGQMVMGHIANAVINGHNNLIDDTLAKLGWKEFDWLISHQIGQRPFDRLGELNGIEPSTMIKTLDKLGNITSASFPVNFHKLLTDGIAKAGDRIGGCFAGSGLVVGQFGYRF